MLCQPLVSVMMYNLLISSAILATASALDYFGPAPYISWRNANKTAIVKLDTPGYSLWVQTYDTHTNKHYFQDENQNASILLNLTMSHDHKQLLMNDQPIVPFMDANVPAMIEALQIRADLHHGRYNSELSLGLSNSERRDSSSWRFVKLDYDILVWSDPLAGPWGNNVPRLRFRVMGMGAHGKNQTVRLEEQTVLHVELTDMNHGQSDDPEAWFEITDIGFLSEEESYTWPPTATKESASKECTTKSWRCPDDQGAFYGLNPEGAPYYRWIWRERFDEFGRKGSLRHDVLAKIADLKNLGPEFYWQWLFIGIIAVSSSVMLFLFCAFFWLKWKDYRAEQRVESDWDDRLLGEKGIDEVAVGEEEADEEDEVDGEYVKPFSIKRKTDETALLVELDSA